MREIKFRAWAKKGKEMIGNIQSSGWFEDFIYNNYVPDTFVVMQFTGLKDKNGKEIYEGDIVKYEYTLPIIGKNNFEVLYKIGFYNGAFLQLRIAGDGNRYDIWEDWNELEIIGNIYENPELLEAKK